MLKNREIDIEASLQQEAYVCGDPRLTGQGRMSAYV